MIFSFKDLHYPPISGTTKTNNLLYRGAFILPLLGFGLMHFILPDFFVFMVPQFVGDPDFWVMFSGIVMITAGLSIYTGYLGRLAIHLFLCYVLTFIMVVDLPMVYNSQDGKRYYFLISILKDLALLGAGIYLLLIQKRTMALRCAKQDKKGDIQQ